MSPLKIKIPSKLCVKNQQIQQLFIQFITRNYVSSDVVCARHITRHNTPIHILSTAPQLSISQKALEMLAEDDNVTPKHVGATIHN
jgi:hypothetical protein